MNIFNSLTKPLTWLMALLLTAFVAGCGSGGVSDQAGTPVITAYSIGGVTATIDQTAKTITVDLPNDTDVTALVATYSTTGTGSKSGINVTVGTVAQVSGSTAGDFTNPVIYTVTAPDGTAVSYTVTALSLASIAVSSPAPASLPISGIKQYTATATYTNGSSTVVTTSASWTSANTAVATIGTNSGLATGVAAGTSLITASFHGKTATANLTVSTATLVSIAVTPATASVPLGVTQAFVATATYSSGAPIVVTTSAVWTSATPAVATVVSATGVASGVTVGSSVITASFGGKTATATLTVTAATLTSIAVTPATASVPAGVTQTFVATPTYSDGPHAAVVAAWTSATPGVATVAPTTGVATGVAVGSSVITATFGGKTATATLTVTAATLTSISVTPATATIAILGTQQFVATPTYSDGVHSAVTASSSWSAVDVAPGSGVASVGSNTGLATGLSAGSSVITATFSGKAASATLAVSSGLPNPTAPVLGEAGRFVILAPQAVTTTGVTAISNGDIGISPAARSLMTGFTAVGATGSVAELTNGTTYAADDANPSPYPVPLHFSTPVIGAPWTTTAAMLTQANTDMGIADTFLAADPNPGVNVVTQVCPTELGTLVLTRGVYKTASNVGITTGALTLDAQGDPNAVFIFNIGGTLSTGAPGGNIVLINGALAKNVYWRTAGITTIGAGTIFKGFVFASTQVNVLSGANITGSLFAVTDRVTLIADTITKAP